MTPQLMATSVSKVNRQAGREAAGRDAEPLRPRGSRRLPGGAAGRHKKNALGLVGRTQFRRQSLEVGDKGGATYAQRPKRAKHLHALGRIVSVRNTRSLAQVRFTAMPGLSWPMIVRTSRRTNPAPKARCARDQQGYSHQLEWWGPADHHVGTVLLQLPSESCLTKTRAGRIFGRVSPSISSSLHKSVAQEP
jgi:hypothetical protein